jgi:hypothetical protein
VHKLYIFLMDALARKKILEVLLLVYLTSSIMYSWLLYFNYFYWTDYKLSKKIMNQSDNEICYKAMHRILRGSLPHVPQFRIYSRPCAINK